MISISLNPIRNDGQARENAATAVDARDFSTQVMGGAPTAVVSQPQATHAQPSGPQFIALSPAQFAQLQAAQLQASGGSSPAAAPAQGPLVIGQMQPNGQLTNGQMQPLLVQLQPQTAQDGGQRMPQPLLVQMQPVSVPATQQQMPQQARTPQQMMSGLGPLVQSQMPTQPLFAPGLRNDGPRLQDVLAGLVDRSPSAGAPAAETDDDRTTRRGMDEVRAVMAAAAAHNLQRSGDPFEALRRMIADDRPQAPLVAEVGPNPLGAQPAPLDLGATRDFAPLGAARGSREDVLSAMRGELEKREAALPIKDVMDRELREANESRPIDDIFVKMFEEDKASLPLNADESKEILEGLKEAGALEEGADEGAMIAEVNRLVQEKYEQAIENFKARRGNGKSAKPSSEEKIAESKKGVADETPSAEAKPASEGAAASAGDEAKS